MIFNFSTVKSPSTKDESISTLDANFKGTVFAYLGQGLLWNQQSIKNHSLTFCKERFLLNQRVFYFPKGFFLVDEVNYQISELSANGVLNYLISKYVDYAYLNIETPKLGPRSIAFEEISGIFFVSGGLLLLSFSVFVLEVVCQRVKLN